VPARAVRLVCWICANAAWPTFGVSDSELPVCGVPLANPVTSGFALPVELDVDHVPDRPRHREEQPFKQRETPSSPSPPGTGCRQRAQREPGAAERGEGKPVDGHVLKCARLAQYGRDERVTIHMGWKEPLVAALAAFPTVITLPGGQRRERYAYLFWRVRLPLWIMPAAAGWLVLSWPGIAAGLAAGILAELIFSYRAP